MSVFLSVEINSGRNRTRKKIVLKKFILKILHTCEIKKSSVQKTKLICVALFINVKITQLRGIKLKNEKYNKVK